jgi:transglutaminase-like putative cysteine protease
MTALAGERSRRIELVCFAALACVAALRWTALVSDPPSGRVTFAVVVATAAGAGLAAIAGLRASRRVRWTLGGVTVLAAILLGLVLVGLPARLLLPVNWGELGSNVGASLDGLADVPVPYAGADLWTRLVIVLVSPLVVAVAALVAFWPQRRRAAARIAALVLLVGLYLIAVAWARPERQLAGGALLLVLVCAWLWLPGLETGRRTAALAAVAAAGIAAVPAAALVDPGRPLLDYRQWNLLSANGQSFRWDQSYGPLDWPQRGRLLLEIASDRSHYWKATNLDRFDGVRWLRSASSAPEPALGQPRAYHPKGALPRPDPAWVDRINFSVRGLSSDFAVAAGTVLAITRAQARPAGDGVWEMTRELRPGSSYTALVYDPNPSGGSMRAAGTKFPGEARRYVTFALPGPDGTRELEPRFWKHGPPPIGAEVADTPYAGMYALARRLAAGAPSPYDAARRIQRYLRDTYPYRQNVPDHQYPLPTFLAVDRAGYCQQFSGTMALMLRMLGIPSRVAAGFSPGGRDPEHNDFLVDDTDAHNWVEVFFPTIGWVTFEPTPAAAPAQSQLGDVTLSSSKTDTAVNLGSPLDLPDPRGGDAPESKQAPARVTPGAGGSSGSNTGAIGAVAGAALVLAALLLYGARRLRTARLEPDALAAAELRELDRALDRLGSPLPPGATLRIAEKRLAELGGPAAARYATALSDRRYRRPDLAPPGMAQRRSLRRSLLGALGPRGAIRVLRALPPGGPAPSPRRGRGGRSTSRSGARPRPASAGAAAASAAGR